MDIRVIPIGGYNEVGKNMTAVQVDDEVVIFDMGFFLPKLVEIDSGQIDRRDLTKKGLQRFGIIPDDSCLDSLKNKVKAIIPGHAHLDHMGAIPHMADKYNCPIIGTPFTMEILKASMKDEKINLPNKLITLKDGRKYRISKKLEVEFIHITHSTMDTVLIALHTKEGSIVYANDFKLDDTPVLDRPPDYKKMKRIRRNGVHALIMDTLYANSPGKTPSESVARSLIKDVILGTQGRDNAIILTSFASQLERVHSAIEFGKKLNRKVVLLGRSMHKYITAAERAGLVDFSKKAEIVGYSRKVEGKLREIQKKGREKYLIICTGNQAEPGAILTRMSTGKLPFKFKPNDKILFSSKTIPVHPNIEQREALEKRLRSKKARLFLDLHVSGHSRKEDLRDMITIFRPKHIIPCQGTHEHMKGMVELGIEHDYKLGKTVHKLNNGKALNLK